jgi:L-lysine 2,3-aminomutase
MGHVNHPIELSTSLAVVAIKKIIASGAVIRLQSPIIRYINDNASVWAQLWNTGVNLGLIPYYMFVERDTGPRNYFKVPLAQALQIFNKAYQSVSGLARTVRGPVMSAFPGKVLVNSITEINNEKVFVLQFIQARKPENVRQLFFAKYNENASWLNELKPFGDNDKFFFE